MKTFIYTSLFLLFSLISGAQNPSQPVKKIYNYKFTGTVNLADISTIENNLSRLQEVKTVKIKYKSESAMGEVFVETEEKAPQYEGQTGFSLVDLKKMLQAEGLTPGELTITNL